jgi:hypothetical protein
MLLIRMLIQVWEKNVETSSCALFFSKWRTTRYFSCQSIAISSRRLSTKRVSFEYYLTVSDRCCRNAFKIALAVGNMRLNRIQQRYNSSDAFVDTVSEDVIGKRIVGNHAVN